jgi:hypothetical protein
MKKLAGIALLFLLPLLLTGCFLDRAEVRTSIITLYEENRETFLAAAVSGDFSAVEALEGITSVTERKNHVDIFCRGFGLGSATSYFGIYYSPSDDLCAAYGALPLDELQPEGNGWRYREPEGDNTFYVEPLGDHFFYYYTAF